MEPWISTPESPKALNVTVPWMALSLALSANPLMAAEAVAVVCGNWLVGPVPLSLLSSQQPTMKAAATGRATARDFKREGRCFMISSSVKEGWNGGTQCAYG